MEFERSLQRLLDLVLEKSVRYGYFVLASGKESSYYFDGRLTTLWPEGALLVGRTFFEVISRAGVDAVGGPTLGADPIVGAVVLTSQLEGRPIPGFIVRKEPKRHGTQRHVEGHLPEKGTVALVDDVITTGGSLLRAIEVVESAGCRVAKVVVLLDRNQGGSLELRKRGYDFTALLSADAQGKVSIGCEA